MKEIYKCPKCGESKNLHYNYDYNKQHRPVIDVLCNECGEVFGGDLPVAELRAKYTSGQGYSHYLTKPGFVERRMAIGKANNDKLWDELYNEYDGVSDLHDFVDWLKKYYIAPEKI